MAKVGNEAKLILRLAQERAEQKVTAVFRDNGNTDYYAGYRDAMNWLLADIAQLCFDLEAK